MHSLQPPLMAAVFRARMGTNNVHCDDVCIGGRHCGALHDL